MSKLHGRENDTVEVDVVEKSEVARREEVIQAFWEEHDIFHKSIETPAGGAPKGDFVFYDGPPFATGTPHYGHILAGTIKDAIPRFWTMQGYRVRRTWGWDCHGLPLENLIEKKLGLATKRDIEAYGVKNFNEAARATVMEYADDWAKVVPRMGRWADMQNDYKTMDSTYTESVWWVFSELNKKGLVYEGFKTMHLCPRCGTTLSNFEVNLGYKDIKDIAVTVKLPLLDDTGNATDTSLLVWTTTPWTLPGNMAAAVHKDFKYNKLKIKSEAGKVEHIILAKERVAAVLGAIEGEVVEEMKGADLVGRSYQPPFDYWQKQEFEGKDKAWKIYHADYVELGEEGTGAVHLAPAYGEEDMQLAKVHGVPIAHHVDESGHFKDFVTDFAGQLVKPKDDDEAGVDHKAADIEVLKKLQELGKVFKKENITHSYPHCWRCDTPLLNYATTSWFVEATKIRDELVAANNTVKWVPEHVGSNRFGRWLEGVRDWAVSRQRYWGAPLPIWKNPVTGQYKVFGSLSELQQRTRKSGNTYVLMRHGESESNVRGVISADPETVDGLTEKGREQVTHTIATLKNLGIDLIIHSGYQRTRETAQMVATALGLDQDAVVADMRIGEVKTGAAFEGGVWDHYNQQYGDWEGRFTKHFDDQENRRDAQTRAAQFLFDVEAQYKNKKILVISHGGVLFALECAASGADIAQALYIHDTSRYMDNAEVRSLTFVPFPHNDNFLLDYHRPYIDEYEVFDEDGTKLVRVPDVFDCWFESGSMPYGQHHYPFSCEEEEFGKEYFPAQFIAEGLDQTRGWFYSLIVLGTALFGKSPYEHVIVNGLVMAEDGKKMSKKLRNYPDPMEVADRVGADAIRYYLLTSPVVRGEDLSFSEREVLEQQRKNIGRLHNVLAMYELYADSTKASDTPTHVLDHWIIARLNQLVAESEAGYKAYELDRATRPIADFIDDLSVWYLRRSRDRFKSDDQRDKQAALATLRHTLRTLALVMAPVMPFYAEYLWQAVKAEDDAESVHLGAWPKGGEVDSELVEAMAVVRQQVTIALELRTKAGIKVRQPLATLELALELPLELVSIIKDEVNVKEVRSGAVVKLDTTLTPELIAEGNVREFMRGVQEQRKENGLAPADRVVLTIGTSPEGQALIERSRDTIMKTVGAADLVFAPTEGATIAAGEYSFVVSLVKRT